MRRNILLWAMVTVTWNVLLSAQSEPQVRTPKTSVQAPYGKLPLVFEMNQGQSGQDVKFISRGSGYTAFLTTNGLVLALHPRQHSSAASSAGRESRILRFQLVGASSKPLAVGEDPQSGRVNYFFGNDPSQWHRNVPVFAKVRYKSVYPGIDLVYYGNHRQMEYDFEVLPAGKPGSIEFEVRGADTVSLDQDHNLVLQVGTETLTFQSPVVYQSINSQLTRVEGGYVMKDSTHVAFQVASYDATKPLVIDPVLVYSTYLGGSGDDNATAVAVDNSGDVYVVGYTDSTDFPLATLGSLPAGTNHVFVAKLDPTASNLIYADYLGGNGEDFGYALTLDGADDVYVTGSTESSNFPVVNAYQATYPGFFNAFVTTISPDGSALLYSTYLGGNGIDTPVGIALDANADIIVAGSTSSTNFPVSSAYQPAVYANGGGVYGEYGFLTELAAGGSSLVFSTYLGGNSNVPYNCGGTPCWGNPETVISGLSLDPQGNAYVAGNTNTYNFPTTTGSYLSGDSTQENALVGFLSKFNTVGNLEYSTYFYESSGLLTHISALAVDASGSAYVTGLALSDGTFPITSTSICNPSVSAGACSYGFVTKFNTSGSALLYSTFLGPDNFATPIAISLDANDDAYVAAVSSSAPFNTVNAIEQYTSGNDILLAEVDPTASSELWATYFGGSQDDAPAGMTIDSNGNLYLTGTTDSTDFPTTQGAFQTNEGGGVDAFVTKVSPAVAAAVSLSPLGLEYAEQSLDSTSAAQEILLRNVGSASLSISSITTTGDFEETDNCAPGIAAASSCSLSITFTPSAAGSRNGTVSIQDNASGSPHIIELSGTGLGPSISATPSSLAFPSTTTGNTSASQTITLSNTGNAALSINNIRASSNFSQSNNCATSLAANASCTINVAFAPTAGGTLAGTLSISDNAPESPQTFTLSGIGSDFSLSGSPATSSVKSGSNVTYQLTIAPVGGTFSNAVALTCSGLPKYAACSFSPSSVTPGSTPAASTLTITTSSTSAQSSPQSRGKLSYEYGLLLPGFAVFGVFLSKPKKSLGLLRIMLLVAGIASLAGLNACAGGLGIVNPPGGSTTAPGSYTITVVGTSGTLQHSTSVSLVVQ